MTYFCFIFEYSSYLAKNMRNSVHEVTPPVPSPYLYNSDIREPYTNKLFFLRVIRHIFFKSLQVFHSILLR